jgi:predicted nucleic acid-binding protein
MPLNVYPGAGLIRPVLDVAAATGRTVHDSLYPALATSLGCRLVTADRGFYQGLQDGPFAACVLRVADPV